MRTACLALMFWFSVSMRTTSPPFVDPASIPVPTSIDAAKIIDGARGLVKKSELPAALDIVITEGWRMNGSRLYLDKEGKNYVFGPDWTGNDLPFEVLRGDGQELIFARCYPVNSKRCFPLNNPFTCLEVFRARKNVNLPPKIRHILYGKFERILVSPCLSTTISDQFSATPVNDL